MGQKRFGRRLRDRPKCSPRRINSRKIAIIMRKVREKRFYDSECDASAGGTRY